MYDKTYYDDRKVALEKKVGETKDKFITKVGNVWNEFAKDINDIQADGKDLLDREEMSKKEAGVEEPKETSQEAPKKAEPKGAKPKPKK